MVETNHVVCFILCLLCQFFYLLGILHCENTLNTLRTGKCLGNLDDQVRHLDKLYQNLGHVVYQRYYCTLCNNTAIYTDCPGPEQNYQRNIYNDISKRIHGC